MKRCPQCEFIYEDDQSLCDMDGVLLVLDSRSLPNNQALAPVSGSATKAQKRNRTVPAFATLILVIVLGMVYFVTQRSAARYTPASTTSTAAPETNPAPPVQPVDVSQPPAAIETRSPEKEETKPAETKPAAVAPARKSSATKTASTQTKAPPEQKKDESKVGSILKKTGRILKKPFKF
jgi:cell division protein FtsN